MKSEKIVWGITLVFIGTILLLDNFDIIDFYWRSVWHFWPIILILSGLNLVFGRAKQSPIGRIMVILLTCIVLGFVAYVGSTRSKPSTHWFFNDDEDLSAADSNQIRTFSETYNAAVAKAELNIEGGATVYELEQTTPQLFEAEVNQSYGQYSLTRSSTDSVEILNFKMNDGEKSWHLNKSNSNKAIIRLNTNPIWTIRLDMGAGKADFDLSAYKLSDIAIKGGASAFELKLGQPLALTKVSVDTGVSDVKISIPENVACQIEYEGGLTSKSFEGFDKKEDGLYVSPNYATASTKINIKLHGGLSSFNVKRY
ncbi:MAG: LiaF transmembrane domain-containing protein [Sphingobacteriaceae bacterium]